MKKLVISLLVLGSSMAFAGAEAHTHMNGNWVCTTNASSSDVEGDKKADDHMANTKGAASHAFSFAEKHCHDCTKITCEVKN